MTRQKNDTFPVKLSTDRPITPFDMFNEAQALSSTRKQDALISSSEVIPLRKVFKKENDRAVEERQNKIARLKEQVQNGTYKPNLELIAERMLSEIYLSED